MKAKSPSKVLRVSITVPAAYAEKVLSVFASLQIPASYLAEYIRRDLNPFGVDQSHVCERYAYPSRKEALAVASSVLSGDPSRCWVFLFYFRRSKAVREMFIDASLSRSVKKRRRKYIATQGGRTAESLASLLSFPDGFFQRHSFIAA